MLLFLREKMGMSLKHEVMTDCIQGLNASIASY